MKAAVLVPTETGLRKSILDAIGPLREYLKEAGVHDYLAQAQGKEAKHLVDALLECAGPSSDGFLKPEAPEPGKIGVRKWTSATVKSAA